MWLVKAYTSQKATTYRSGSSSQNTRVRDVAVILSPNDEDKGYIEKQKKLLKMIEK